MNSQETWRQTQANIFAAYGWHDRDNLLHLLTRDRVDYMVSRIERVWGTGAFAQQEILEIGCGGGLLCGEMARRGVAVTGIDPSQAALVTARQHVTANQLGHSVSLAVGSAEALPYADGSFSVIVCMDVLEHVRDLHATIREIARVLAPGGIFLFDTINRTFAARLALIWFGEHFLRRRGLVPGLHSYAAFIKPQELTTELTLNNLEVRELTGFMPGLVKGRLTLTPGWFKGVSYIGYALKA